MTTSIITEPESLELEDELTDLTADLLSLRMHEPVLQKIFATPSGTWKSLNQLNETESDFSSQLNTLQEQANGPLKVTWLNHPELDEGFCLVLFYLDALGWNNLAIYNRQRLANNS